MSLSLLFVVLLLLLGGIVFIHYLQGFFSSTLSAIFAVIAAVVAFSYHETIVESLLAGKVANSAHAMVLLMLFALIYMALRIIADKAIPGQVRLPAIVDKVGGAVMGLIAGVFALGIVAIAAQELPFGPSIAGYDRYVTNDRKVSIPGSGVQRGLDGMAYDELKAEDPGRFDPEDQHSVLFDDAVVNTVSYLSHGGSLEGRQPLVSIHPDFLQELFGQRLGIEPGGKRVAMNLPAQRLQDVVLKGIYATETLNSLDSEQKGIRPEFFSKVTKQISAGKDEVFLVIRVQFSGRTAGDDDRLFRFSPGSVRLLVPGADGENAVNYFPIGTLTNSTLYADKLDDFLLVDLKEKDRGADLVFRVKRRGLFHGGGSHARTIVPGAFIEVKRLAREEISGKSVSRGLPALDPDYSVIRKKAVLAEPPVNAVPVQRKPPDQTSTPAPAPIQNPAQIHPNSPQSIAGSTTSGIFSIESAKASNTLPTAIGVGADAAKLSVPLSGGDAILKRGKFLSLSIDVMETLANLEKGAKQITELVPPPDQGLLQVQGTVPDKSWNWGDKADQFEVVDTAGKHYKANGAWALVEEAGERKFFARYSTDFPLAPITAQNGSVIKLWLCFGVAHNVAVTQLLLGTTVIADLNGVKVP